MTLPTRLTFLVVPFVLVVTGGVGVLLQRQLTQVLIARALHESETRVTLLAGQMDAYSKGAREDLVAIRASLGPARPVATVVVGG
ncbi:MAG TPA: hypothetical protein VGI57_13250, partial [Usitatibacter sp.]